MDNPYDFIKCPDCGRIIDEFPCEYCGHGEDWDDDPTPDYHPVEGEEFADNY